MENAKNNIIDPLEILNNIPKFLSLGKNKRTSGFRSGCFSTFSKDYPNSRWVVLRDYKLSPLNLIFYTHYLSNKISELKKNNKCNYSFFAKDHNIQLRFYGIAKIEYNTKSSNNLFESLNDFQKNEYLLKKPGQSYELPITQDISYFTKVIVEIQEFEFLQLSREEHIKYRFTKNHQNPQSLKDWKTPWIHTRVIP